LKAEIIFHWAVSLPCHSFSDARSAAKGKIINLCELCASAVKFTKD
jgi:hypothetical protein